MVSPRPPHRNYFRQDLFFVLEEGILRVTPYTEFWYDKALPESKTVNTSTISRALRERLSKAFILTIVRLKRG